MTRNKSVTIIVQKDEEILWRKISLYLLKYNVHFITPNSLQMYSSYDKFINKGNIVLVSSIIDSFLLESQILFFKNHEIPFIVIAKEHSFQIEQRARNLGCTSYLFPDENVVLQDTIAFLLYS